jgi:hypothetical protein
MQVAKDIFCLLIFLILPVSLSVQSCPAGIFADHMVLQRDVECTVWGGADKGNRVIKDSICASRWAADRQRLWLPASQSVFRRIEYYILTNS